MPRMIQLLPLEVSGSKCFTVSELAVDLCVSRQTMWRWRREGEIPSGSRFRNRQVVFTPEKADAVLEYANRVEPITEVG